MRCLPTEVVPAGKDGKEESEAAAATAGTADTRGEDSLMADGSVSGQSVTS